LPPDPTDQAASLRRRTFTILAVFLVFWATWLSGLGYLRHHHSGFDHGDPTTDSNILNGGENFDREGLFASYGIPAVDTYRADGKKPDYYVTYPPGGYWFHQLLKACGIHTLEGFRLGLLVVSGLAVLVLLALLYRLSGDILPAAISCTLYLTAKPFIEYGDNLHYISLSQLTLFATLYAWTRFEDAQSPRASLGWLAAAAAIFFADSWLTFEHALFVLAFAAIRALWFRQPTRLIPVALLGAIPALVLGIRILLDRAVLGSFSAVFAVLRAKAEQRVGSASVGTGFHALLEAWLPRLSWPASIVPADSPDAEFSLPLLSWWFAAPAAALLVFAIATWHLPGSRPFRRALGAGLLLLVAGLTWFAAMTEHALVHRFTAMLILPGIAATAGALIAVGFAQRSLHPPGAPARCVGRVLAVFALVAWIVALRTSFAVNLAARDVGVKPPSAAVAAAIDRREQALAAFAAVGRSLAETNRLVMYTYDAPAARAIRRPFDNAPNTIPAELQSGAAFLIPLWWPDARHAAAKAAASLGLPDQLAPTIDPYLLFRPGRDDTDRVIIATNGELKLTRLAWRPTVDGSGWCFTALATGPLDQLRAAGFVLELHARAADGVNSPLASLPIPDADGLRDGNTVLFRVAFASSVLDPVSEVDVRAVTPGRPRRSGFDAAKSERPSSAAEAPAWTLTDQSISWSTPPWKRPSHSTPPTLPTPPIPSPEPQPER
jgi:hypothetical protein